MGHAPSKDAGQAPSKDAGQHGTNQVPGPYEEENVDAWVLAKQAEYNGTLYAICKKQNTAYDAINSLNQEQIYEIASYKLTLNKLDSSAIDANTPFSKIDDDKKSAAQDLAAKLKNIADRKRVIIQKLEDIKECIDELKSAAELKCAAPKIEAWGPNKNV